MSLTNFINCWLYILKGNVKLDDEKIPIIKEYHYEDNTPCIIFDDSPGANVIDKYFDYDEHEHFVRVLDQTLNLHVYADSEIARRSIVNQIENLYKQTMSDYYKLCLNYHLVKIPEIIGCCKKLDDDRCLVEEYPTHYRSVKGKCPDPDKAKYCNVFNHFKVSKNSFELQPSFDLDDFTLNTPIYHSIFRTSAVFIDDFDVGGKVVESLKFDTELTK